MVRNTKSTANNQDYRLCKGDVIKLGRIKFKVKNLRVENDVKNKKERLDFYKHDDKNSSSSEGEVGQSEIDDMDLKNIDADSNLNSVGQSSKRCKDQPDPSAREA